jgi:hypothetical protein
VIMRHHVRQLAMIAFAAGATGCSDSGAPTEITIRVFPDGVPSFSGQTRNAPLVAFHPNGERSAVRDGARDHRRDAGWIALTGRGGVYRATATGSHYIVAVGCNSSLDDGISPGLRLYYQTVFDTTDLAVSGCAGPRETVPVTVEIEGAPADAATEVWLGNAMIPGSEGPSELAVPRGTVDVFATTYRWDPVTDALVAMRGYRAPEPIDVAVPYALKLDYGALALPFETHALSVTGFDPADGVSVLSSYATPHSLRQWPLTGEHSAEVYTGEMETTFATVDPRMRRPDDVSNLRVHTRSLAGGLTYDRYVRLAMKEPEAQSLALPPPLVVEPPSIDTAANRAATVRLPIMPAVLQTVDHAVTLRTTVLGAADEPYPVQWSMFVQSGWADGASLLVIATPDLSGLRGWTADMALIANADVEWSIQREDRTMPYDTLPVDGRKILLSVVQGVIARDSPQ